MKKIGLFLIIAMFVSVFASSSYAKKTYLNAGQADDMWDIEGTEPGKAATFGLIMEEKYDEGKGEYVQETDGAALYFLSEKKIKKLYIYGDARGGSIFAFLIKTNSQTGAYEWINVDLSDPNFEPTALDFSSGKATVIDSTIKKSKKEKWLLIVELVKSEEEGAESPIFYGIKYKS